jgi:hypothetical protein
MVCSLSLMNPQPVSYKEISYGALTRIRACEVTSRQFGEQPGGAMSVWAGCPQPPLAEHLLGEHVKARPLPAHPQFQVGRMAGSARFLGWKSNGL